MTLITLLTDFGDRDGYVGAVKGVVLALAPDARIVDIAHGVVPGAVSEAAFTWWSALRYMPRGAIHVAVVDPGVGTDRAALGVETDFGILLAPDNGLVTGFLGGFRRAHRLENEAFRHMPVSRTFHGRDVFAPAAGHLAAGADLAAFGPPVERDAVTVLDGFFAHESANTATGRVMAVDRFGNLRTNIPGRWLARGRPLLGSGDGVVEVPLGAETYADVPAGALFAYEGSAGTIEIAVRGGSASEATGLAAGTGVRVEAE